MDNLAVIKGYFEEMLLLARQQLALFEEPASDSDIAAQLTQLVEQRQKIMDNINTAQKQLQEWGENHPAAGASISGDVEKNEILTIISAIQENDQRTRDKAVRVWQEMGQKLGNARKSKQALQQYKKAPGYTGSWFIDKTR